MAGPFEALTALDRLVHEPARLAMLTALQACESCDFLFLQNLTGLTKGNFQAHLVKLEAAGLVEVEKAFRKKTMIRLTRTGRASIAQHWQRLAKLREAAGRWRRAPSTTTD
jgi:DNA-binding MarR family transcriptional regulator